MNNLNNTNEKAKSKILALNYEHRCRPATARVKSSKT